MTYIPKKNGKARKLSFLFILCGILIWMLSALDIPYRSMIQLAAIAVVVIGVQFLVRYVLSDFKYIIEDNEDGSSDFIIYKLQGSRETKVCHISLGKTVAVFKYSSVPNYIEKYGKTSNRYNYCQNSGRNLAYVLLFHNGEDLIEVWFEPDEIFAGALRSRMTGDGDGKGFIM